MLFILLIGNICCLDIVTYFPRSFLTLPYIDYETLRHHQNQSINLRLTAVDCQHVSFGFNAI